MPGLAVGALTYTVGFVLWEIQRSRLQPEAGYAAQWRELLADLEPSEYPTLTGPVSDAVTTTASDEQFRWGLARIIARSG